MRRDFLLVAFFCVALAGPVLGSGGDGPREIDYPVYPGAPLRQSEAQAEAKSAGCMTCHTQTDRKTMHTNPGVTLGCTDCHGGDAAIQLTAGVASGAPEYANAMEKAHVPALYPDAWGGGLLATPNAVIPCSIASRRSSSAS